MQNRPPFPAQWHKKLLDLVSDLDNPLLVQLATLSGKTYPESRTVILRFVPSLEKLYVCTNTTYPKWKQVKSHPYVALSTYAQTSRLALRLKANTSCFYHDSSFFNPVDSAAACHALPVQSGDPRRFDLHFEAIIFPAASKSSWRLRWRESLSDGVPY
jgi:hypothetical protein